ncbi:hypothetical protein Tsubulata_051041 [Turnera subulata]|uniref:F-box domain-containing protein n=1 Tax=Turnera subulata TaxID=218843 RepID=A0A9Q0J6W1_9ROSI|nr:hypothetical protein Tsubulata_051041 [Turnera subulata]
MEENQTSKKCKKEEDNSSDDGGGEDRLTILPDEILCHILSFLGTRCAVKTSVLSRRWRYLWTMVTVLHMDRDEFLTVICFKKFVRHVLKKRHPTANVDNLYFRIHGSMDKLITSWPLEYAASHNVNHLTVDFGNHVHLTTAEFQTKILRPIPDALLTSCPTLKTLELSGFRLPESFAFTTVTSLHLAACKFPLHSDTFDFSARFPNLEELWLRNCEFLRLKVVKISGSKLLRLHVDRGYLDVQFSRCNFQISASNVTFFSCTWATSRFTVINLPSVKHLLIRFSSMHNERYLADIAKRERDAFLVFLQGLSMVEFITMSECMLKVLMSVPGLEHQPSPFSSLKLLKLIADAEDRPVSMPVNVKNYLLSGSPCAETAFVE